MGWIKLLRGARYEENVVPRQSIIEAIGAFIGIRMKCNENRPSPKNPYTSPRHFTDFQPLKYHPHVCPPQAHLCLAPSARGKRGLRSSLAHAGCVTVAYSWKRRSGWGETSCFCCADG